MRKSYEMDMTRGPLLRSILIFTLPLLLSGVLQLLFNATDIVVVGQFAGANAMASVGSTTSLFNLLINAFIGISVGANVLVARYCGEKNYDGVQQTVQTSLLTGLVGGVILVVLGIVLARPMLTLMKTPDEVIEGAVLYMRVYFIGMPATMIYNFGAAVLRAVGDTRRPLYFLMAAGVMNVLGDLLFVCVLGMGVAGVALATVLSQCVSAALTVLCLTGSDGMCHLDIRRLRFYPERFAQIMKIGLPAGMQSVIFNISNVLIQSSINSFGAVAVAGNTAAANVEGFVYISMNSLYQTQLHEPEPRREAVPPRRRHPRALHDPRHPHRRCARTGRIPSGRSAAAHLLAGPGGHRLRHSALQRGQRDVFPVRHDGCRLGRGARPRLFDHADACVHGRRVRVPRHLDLHRVPYVSHAVHAVRFLSDLVGPDRYRTYDMLSYRPAPDVPGEGGIKGPSRRRSIQKKSAETLKMCLCTLFYLTRC